MDATKETDRKGRLINHSKLRSNCMTKVVTMKDGKPKLAFFTNRKVQAGEGHEFDNPVLLEERPPSDLVVLFCHSGEELTYDYGDRSLETLKAHPWLAN